MQVRVTVAKGAGRRPGNDGTGHGTVVSPCCRETFAQGLPGTVAQFEQQLSVPQERSPYELARREHYMAIRDRLEHGTGHELPKFEASPLTAGRTDAALATDRETG